MGIGLVALWPFARPWGGSAVSRDPSSGASGSGPWWGPAGASLMEPGARRGCSWACAGSTFLVRVRRGGCCRLPAFAMAWRCWLVGPWPLLARMPRSAYCGRLMARPARCSGPIGLGTSTSACSRPAGSAPSGGAWSPPPPPPTWWQTALGSVAALLAVAGGWVGCRRPWCCAWVWRSIARWRWPFSTARFRQAGSVMEMAR